MCFAPQRRALSRLRCFVHFDFGMCFVPQRRALFNISTFKVFPTRQFLTLLTSKCASRHNGVQFFISHLARWLRTRRFSEPTFRPSGATNHWKNSESRLFYLFSRPHLLSSDSFSSLILFLLLLLLLLLFSSLTPPLLFHLSILSEVWFLNFLTRSCYHIVHCFLFFLRDVLILFVTCWMWGFAGWKSSTFWFGSWSIGAWISGGPGGVGTWPGLSWSHAHQRGPRSSAVSALWCGASFTAEHLQTLAARCRRVSPYRAVCYMCVASSLESGQARGGVSKEKALSGSMMWACDRLVGWLVGWLAGWLNDWGTQFVSECSYDNVRMLENDGNFL